MDMPDLPAFLDQRGKQPAKPLVWSFTFLHTYVHICPFQAAERYVYKTVQFKGSPASKWGDTVHEAMELRVGGGKPLPVDARSPDGPVNMQRWERFAAPFDGRGARVELKLGITREGQACDFFAKNVWGRGKVDLALIAQPNAYMLDWKSGNSKYESPFELEIGALLLAAEFPGLTNIRGQFAWLKEDRLGETYDLSNVAHTWKFVNEVMREVEKDRERGKFAKRQGPLCAWCPCYGCEHNKNPEKPQ